MIMPFGLKNAGATYQRLMNKIFKEQIRRNMEVYMDDMLVNSKVVEYHIADLEETFTILRCFHMKLNPNKCAFGITFGKFLEFMVSQHRIKASLEKIRALRGMAPLQTIKEVQCLTGMMAALGRFLSRSVERSMLFFKALKQPKNFYGLMNIEQHLIN